MFCKVVTASRSIGIGNGLTYEIDEPAMKVGMPVRVPLRKGLIEGIVVEILKERQEDQYDVKQIERILGNEPLLTESQLKTVQWMSEYYCCTLRQALSVWLPATPWARVLPPKIMSYRISDPAVASRALLELKGKKQKAVLDYLMNREWTSRQELQDAVGAANAVLTTLREKKLIVEEARTDDRHVTVAKHSIRAAPILTASQEAMYESIKKDARPSLLFGVTGSGKTEIYAQLIADAVAEGKQAIMLVPEILLTEHSIVRLETLLEPSLISTIHSRLTQAERRREWQRIHKGEVALVLGSRSALFAPMPNLGLVILDEEHEWTYKNEQTPRYHARETAEALCRFSKAKLVLGTATPSLESWVRTKNGHYHVARLPQRFKDQPLPTVRIIDLADAQFGTAYPFTAPLLDAIGERLKKGEQTVLFLNRRGVASALLCLQCRRRLICPESQLPYTLHHTSTGRPYLLDHTSGQIADVPERCPHCSSTKLHPIGAGTQKIEQILQAYFPKARLIRADSDSIREPAEMRELLRKMRDGEADILLGTQSVVKGLDLPQVTLAAVLLADIGLSLPHFRAGERIFQLLTQLTGRSGRTQPGEVIIQTFRPDSPEVVFASKHETEKYMEAELKLRVFSQYPPATQMIRLIFRGKTPELDAKKVQRRALELISRDVTDLRASVSQTFFGGGKEWQVLLRGTNPRSLLQNLDLSQAVVDVDPMETM